MMVKDWCTSDRSRSNRCVPPMKARFRRIRLAAMNTRLLCLAALCLLLLSFASVGQISPPTISDVHLGNFTATSVQVTVSVPADGDTTSVSVEYGTDTNYGTLTG